MTSTDDNDAYLSNNTDDGSQYAGNLGVTNAVDLAPDSVLPMGEATKNIYTGIQSHEWSDVVSGVADFGANALAFSLDPLNWLISAGLTFLIDFVQPLEDLLSLVTGNSERMEPYAEQWQQLGAALVPLAEAVRQAANDELIEWVGRDAAAAKARLLEFADAIEATGGEAASLSGLLTLFSKLMGAAQQIIIGIIATLIEWMIVEWAVAMAAAAPTMGGSVAAAGAATGVQATVATSRAVRVIDKVVRLLLRIRELMAKVLPAPLMAKVGESVVDFRGGAAVLSTGLRIVGGVLRDPAGYAGPAVNLGTGAWKNHAAGDSRLSDAEIDTRLDVTK
ncbi:hypothetical protein [Micromonospora auratinigra]|uniref:hypothetical protein n=1 Tax=Micromonospora auratinigra TaxID=261654 RepID=UPI000B8524D5|nr:hypothetical protein [Micromonospora auratinigra]